MPRSKSAQKKFKRAVTDSLSTIKHEEGRDAINNLLSIYCAVTSKTVEQAEKEFDGKGYGDFKKAIGEAVVAELTPIQEEYARLMNNKDYLEKIYKDGAMKANEIAEKTLKSVYNKVGFIER